MAENNVMTKITDNLLKVYDYAFLEGATYGFYKPNDAMYVGVRMTEKQYNCPGCGKSFRVKIRNDNDGILYRPREAGFGPPCGGGFSL